MSVSQKNPLRQLMAEEQQQRERIAKASSERRDVVRRAKALLALAQHHTFTAAGRVVSELKTQIHQG